jgi:hypothetical protein
MALLDETHFQSKPERAKTRNFQTILHLKTLAITTTRR